MKKLFGIFLIMVLVLTSCSGPLDKKYSEATFSADMKEIIESDGIDSTEAMYIGLYTVRAEMLGEELEGKTYGELLDNAKELQRKADEQKAKEKALADKVAREEAERTERLSKALTVALYDKGYVEYNYQDYLTYGVAYDNKSGKNIRAIKGTLVINDLFDSEIKSIGIVEDEGITVGETLKMSYTTDYNQFMDEDTRLKSKDLKDLKVVWKPEKIIFEDGSTLE